MIDMQNAFEGSYKDLEKANEYNKDLKESLIQSRTDVECLKLENQDLQKQIQEKEERYNILLQEIDIRESEKEKIIDHIKRQAENTVAFYKNKYERKIREQ